MALIVEDGTAPAGANSYVTEAYVEAFCDDRGITIPADIDTKAVRATYWLDGRYRARYPGLRENGRDQSLEWPREDAVDRDGNEIPEASVPVEIKDATCVAIIRAADLYPTDGGGTYVKREKLGSLEVEYGSPQPDALRVPEIDDILGRLIDQPGLRLGGMVPLLRA